MDSKCENLECPGLGQSLDLPIHSRNCFIPPPLPMLSPYRPTIVDFGYFPGDYSNPRGYNGNTPTTSFPEGYLTNNLSAYVANTYPTSQGFTQMVSAPGHHPAPPSLGQINTESSMIHTYTQGTSIPTPHGMHMGNTGPHSLGSNETNRAHGQQSNTTDDPFRRYVSPEAERSSRSNRPPNCISCFDRRACKPGSTPDHCEHCEGRPVYCRGIFKPPMPLEDVAWSVSATFGLASRFNPSDALISEVLALKLVLSLSTIHQGDEPKAIWEGKFKDIIQDENKWQDLPSLGNIFDMVFPTDRLQKATLGMPVEVIIDPLETATRRLIACLELLRNPQLCTIEQLSWDNTIACYIMLRFLRQLSSDTTCLWNQVNSEIMDFANNKEQRDRKLFPKQKRLIGSILGLLHSSLNRYTSEHDNWKGSGLGLESLYKVPPNVFQHLEWLGHSFHPTSFYKCSKAPIDELPGVRIALNPLLSENFSEPQSNDGVSAHNEGHIYTFVDIMDKNPV